MNHSVIIDQACNSLPRLQEHHMQATSIIHRNEQTHNSINHKGTEVYGSLMNWENMNYITMIDCSSPDHHRDHTSRTPTRFFLVG